MHLLSILTYIALFSISLVEVVFAVGGGTDTAEWLDIEAGDENHQIEPPKPA